MASERSAYRTPRANIGIIVMTGACSEYACASSSEGACRSARFISRRCAQRHAVFPRWNQYA